MGTTNDGRVKAISKFFMDNIIFGIYFGFICVRPEKQRFFYRKNNQVQLQWTRVSQCQSSADSLAKKHSKCLKTLQPKMSAKAQKFGIFEKKFSLGVHSP